MDAVSPWCERKDRVRTVGDVPVTQLPKAGKINAAVLMERSDPSATMEPVSFFILRSSCLRQIYSLVPIKNSIFRAKMQAVFTQDASRAGKIHKRGRFGNVFCAAGFVETGENRISPCFASSTEGRTVL